MQEISIKQNPQTELQKPLFTLMHETLQLANKLGDQNIFLMGQSRSGKSTTFNWINHYLSLIGTGQRLDPVYSFRHQNNTVGQGLAELKRGYKSVTLIPNIVRLPSQQILVDMPGNCDERTQFHVLMVSFIYSVFLNHTRKAKFIIVITNQGFTGQDSAKIKGLVSLFIKLFKCNEMNKEQLQLLFQSVSLLVTGVRVDKGQQQQMQSYYCRLLNEKLQSLREIRQSNQIAEIFPYVQMMLENIINNKRLQLFIRAKKDESPQPCTLLQKFNKRGWSQCQMQKIHPYLQFPYAEQFNKLTVKQQQNLEKEQSEKIKYYEKLQKLLAQFIEVFLQKPISNTYSSDSYYNTYEDIIQFYIEELIEGEQQKENQKEFIDRLGEQTLEISFSPVDVLEGILQLLEISALICLPSQLKANQGGKSYFEYLNSFFLSSVQLIIKYFALTQKSKYVLAKIKSVMSERINCFGYISQLEKFKLSAFYMHLMDYIKIMSVFQYGRFDIINLFLKNSNSQSQLKLGLGHAIRVADYLRDQKQQQFLDLNSFYEFRYKIYKLGSQQYQQDKNYKQSLIYNAFAIVNFIKFKLANQIRAQSQQNKQILNPENNQENAELSDALYKLAIRFLLYNSKKYDELQKLFRDQGIQSHLNMIYQRYLKQRKGQNLDVEFLKIYLQNCQRYSVNNKTQQLYNLIIKLKELSKQEKQIYKEKKKASQRLLNRENNHEQTYLKIQTFFKFAKRILEKEFIKTQDLQVTKKFITQKFQKKKQNLQISHIIELMPLFLVTPNSFHDNF